MYIGKMEERFDITLKHDYVNRVAKMLNSDTIPPGNNDIIHCLTIGKN